MGRREQVEELSEQLALGSAPNIKYLRILVQTQPSAKELIGLGVDRQQLARYLQQVEQYMDGGVEDGTEGSATRLLRVLCGDYRSAAVYSPLRLGVYQGIDEGDDEPQYYQVLGRIKDIDRYGGNSVAYFPLHNTGLGGGLRCRSRASFFGTQDNGEPRFTYVGKQIPTLEPDEAASV